MPARDVLEALYAWTPFLAGGFGWNLAVSLVAMAIGTTLGAVLAVLRRSNRRLVARASLLVTGLTRNVPTFVFLFYLAFLIPVEIQFGDSAWVFPAWIKAALALAIAVVGFVSDNLADALSHWRARNPAAALMFLPNWTSYFVVIVMASSTASVIGVGELVSRCNTVIGAVGRPELMLWVYLYAMLWFFAFCCPLQWLMRQVRAVIARNLAQRDPLPEAATAAP